MENAPPPAKDVPASAPPDRTERNLRVLDRLTELSLAQAEAIHHDVITAAMHGPDGHTAVDLGVKFTRIARSIGQTVALSTKIMNDQKAASNPRPDIDRRRRAAVRAEEYRRKDKVRDTVEQAVRAHAPPNRIYELLMELDERLDDPALEPELDVGRLGPIVERICQDFGVTPNFDNWSDDECGFVVPRPEDTKVPPGMDRYRMFEPPPGPPLTEIIRAERAAAAARKAAEAGAAETAEAEAGAAAAGAAEVGAAEVGAAEVGAAEVGAAEVGAAGEAEATTPTAPTEQRIDPSPD